jgi:hypothetical protein
VTISIGEKHVLQGRSQAGRDNAIRNSQAKVVTRLLAKAPQALRGLHGGQGVVAKGISAEVSVKNVGRLPL